MEDKKFSTDPCSKCGESSFSYGLMLVPICNCCAEERGTNIMAQVMRFCLSCDQVTFPVDYLDEKIISLFNKQLDGLEVIDER
jgi:hypothetical protein